MEYYLPLSFTHSLETKLHSSVPLTLKMERISEGKKSFGTENPPETWKHQRSVLYDYQWTALKIISLQHVYFVSRGCDSRLSSWTKTSDLLEETVILRSLPPPYNSFQILFFSFNLPLFILSHPLLFSFFFFLSIFSFFIFYFLYFFFVCVPPFCFYFFLWEHSASYLQDIFVELTQYTAHSVSTKLDPFTEELNFLCAALGFMWENCTSKIIFKTKDHK